MLFTCKIYEPGYYGSKEDLLMSTRNYTYKKANKENAKEYANKIMIRRLNQINQTMMAYNRANKMVIEYDGKEMVKKIVRT